MTYFDKGDQVLHAVHHLSDGQVLQHRLTHADNLAHLGLIKGQEER